MTIVIPHKQWTLVVGWDKKAKKYGVAVNGIEISELPEAPKSADIYPKFCKSSDHSMYNENIR